jgi:carboxyl-terminal processing protease
LETAVAKLDFSNKKLNSRKAKIPMRPHALKRLLRVATILAITVLAGCAVIDPNNILTRSRSEPMPATVPVPTQDDSWKKDAINFVWSTINDRYYDPKLNGIDWKAVRARYEPLILAAKTDDEYWELLDKMTGELKDSHTRIHPPKMVQQSRAGEVHSLGLGFLEQDGALLLTSVHPQSDAFWAGARTGMTIKSIDGEAALPLFKKLGTEVRDTSTPWARQRGAVRKINSGDIDTKVRMVIERTDKTEIDVMMKRRRFATLPDFTPRLLPSGFGYIRFSNFLGGLQDGILAEIDKMKDTPGMIIDLRNNGGGSGAMSEALLNKFFKDEISGVTLSTRDGKPIKVFFIETMKMEPKLKGTKDKAYTKPVVVLINESSASASEVFSVVMKESGRGTLIGQRTCGCLLAYLGLADVPGGAQMAYSEIGFKTKNGSRVEGEGVTPNIEVRPSREDFLLNRDVVLERAIAHLQSVQEPVKVADAAKN